MIDILTSTQEVSFLRRIDTSFATIVLSAGASPHIFEIRHRNFNDFKNRAQRLPSYTHHYILRTMHKHNATSNNWKQQLTTQANRANTQGYFKLLFLSLAELSLSTYNCENGSAIDGWRRLGQIVQSYSAHSGYHLCGDAEQKSCRTLSGQRLRWQ